MLPDGHLEMKPHLDVVFDDDGPGKSLPVIFMLGTMHRFVRQDVLEKLKPFF